MHKLLRVICKQCRSSSILYDIIYNTRSMYKNCFKICLLNIKKKAIIALEMKLAVFIREKNVENN